MSVDEHGLDLVSRWYAAVQVMKKEEYVKAKEDEITLRRQIVRELFDGRDVGTHTLDLPKGYKLKTSSTNKFKVLKQEEAENGYAYVHEVLAGLPTGIAERLVRWLPELNPKTYLELTTEERKAVDAFVLITPGSPILTLEPPKPSKVKEA